MPLSRSCGVHAQLTPPLQPSHGLPLQTLQSAHRSSSTFPPLSLTLCITVCSLIVPDLATLHPTRNHVCLSCRIAHRSCSRTALFYTQLTVCNEAGETQTRSLTTVLFSFILDRYKSCTVNHTFPLLCSVIELLQHNARIQGTS